MSFIREWVARRSQIWLEGFRLRHGLGNTEPRIQTEETVLATRTEDARVLLHVGCGYTCIENIPLAGFLESSSWREIRLDADPSVAPDIVGTMTDMSTTVSDGVADAIYSSHNIEHLHSHEVPLALAEFCRVLKPTGILVVRCPDLQSLCQLIVDDKLDEPAYFSPMGPIAPIDVLYGYRPAIAAGNLYMAHRCGFTLTTLTARLRNAGFLAVSSFRDTGNFELWVLASKSPRTHDDMAALAKDYLPANS